MNPIIASNAVRTEKKISRLLVSRIDFVRATSTAVPQLPQIRERFWAMRLVRPYTVWWVQTRAWKKYIRKQQDKLANWLRATFSSTYLTTTAAMTPDDVQKYWDRFSWRSQTCHLPAKWSVFSLLVVAVKGTSSPLITPTGFIFTLVRCGPRKVMNRKYLTVNKMILGGFMGYSGGSTMRPW